MSEQPSDDDVETPGRHRAPTPPVPREAILIVDDSSETLTASQLRRLGTLRSAAKRSDDVVVVASNEPDPTADLAVRVQGNDVFTANTSLVRDLRKLGVRRLTIVGSPAATVAATCHAGRRAGFTVDLASLNFSAAHDDLALDLTESDDHGPESAVLLPGTAGDAPVGVRAPLPIDDDRDDAIAWDDTWALRGDRSPEPAHLADQGVRGWISRKLHEARHIQARRPDRS